MEDPLEIIALGIARIETEVGHLRTDVGTLQVVVGTLQTDVGSLRTDVGSLRTEVRRGFARTESRLENIERKIDRHEVRLGALEEKTK